MAAEDKELTQVKVGDSQVSANQGTKAIDDCKPKRAADTLGSCFKRLFSSCWNAGRQEFKAEEFSGPGFLTKVQKKNQPKNKQNNNIV